MRESYKYSGPARVPTCATWPPPWLAEGVEPAPPVPSLPPPGRDAEAVTPPPAAPTPPANADVSALLVELRSEVASARASFPARSPPRPLAVLLDAHLAAGERIVRDREAEAARAWDALALLADLLPMVRSCVERWQTMHSRPGRPTIGRAAGERSLWEGAA